MQVLALSKNAALLALVLASLALGGAAAADPEASVRENLRARGLAAGDVDLLVVRDRYVTRRTGVTHLYLRQQIDGIEVFKGGVSAAVDARGRVIALGDRVVRGLAARAVVRQPALGPAEAVADAARHLELEAAAPLEVLRSPGGPAREVVFAPSALSRDEIPVKLEYVSMPDGLRLAWNVVIRTPDGRHWWNLHVDAADGSFLRKDDWIAHDAYRVFAAPLVNPDEGPRTLEEFPADPVASPFGWHDTNGAAGAEFSDTRGNNASAQEDTDADDAGGYRPNGGGALAFDFPLVLSLQPSNARDASITNLFYWNNRLHDVFYHYGFDEPAGNFQQNNYGHGGAQGDPVQADALDGAGTDNAGFGTPPDGFDPRMEMFRWEQSPAPRLDVTSPPAISGSYGAGKALFGAGTAGLAGAVALAAPSNACTALTNPPAISGKIALVDRGTCDFTVKVANAQAAGAIGAIVANNVAAQPQIITMSGMNPAVTIPALFVTLATGNALKGQLGTGVAATLVTPADRDASLDVGVMVHEYSHGVTNRLTGGPSNVSCLDAPASEGMGEGWSDWFALAFTHAEGDAPEDEREMAAWLIGQPPGGHGIRNHPYSTDLGASPLTYADIAFLNQPHGVGEVWTAALWEMYWNLIAVHGFEPDLIGGSAGNQIAFALVVDALKLQPCDPTFVEGRTALLSADSVANGSAYRCLIWAGFAKRGIGTGATDNGGNPNNLSVVESFAVPAECEPDCGDALLQVGEECDDGANGDPEDGCADDCTVIPEPGQTHMLFAGAALLSLLDRHRRARRVVRT